MMLLADLQTVFAAASNDALWTETIVDRLKAMIERPWPELGRGKASPGSGSPICSERSASARARSKTAASTGGAIAAPTSRKRGQGTAQRLPRASIRYSATPYGIRRDRRFPSTTAKKPVADRNRLGATESAVLSVVAVAPPSGEGEDVDHGELTLDDLDQGAGEGGFTCAYCRKPIAADGGFTATSSGQHLHNKCIDGWAGS